VTYDVRAVTPQRWADLVELFERRGPRGGSKLSPAYGCWCMYWRDRSIRHGEPRKQALERLVREGKEPGLLAYDGGGPVGWVSSGPRTDFLQILRSPQYRPHDDGGTAVWSLVCFAIDRDVRRRGVATALLDAAVEHARSHGATSVEAYPHAADGRDYMGNVELFRRAGFELVRPANKRVIVRLDLT
jgi:GNAT superfamily N-acetyltransferase